MMSSKVGRMWWVWLCWVLGGCVAVGMVVLYRVVEPGSSAFFPKCVSVGLLGVECAGCGSQRVVHALLNFEFWRAFSINPLVVLGMFYVAVVVGLEFVARGARRKICSGVVLSGGMRVGLRVREVLTGRVAMVVWVVAIVFYSVYRNL